MDGKHKTTVDQDTRSAVTQEEVRPHHHENITTAVDREVHQDHHQTRVQPVLDKEVLPEKHTHKVLPVEHKTFEEGSAREDTQRLQQDAAQYKSTSRTANTTHSQSMAPTVAGERIHHHVHEHIQPVIQKETIAPETEHVTVPIHETVHKGAVHHDTTTLPTKTMQEFAGTGGVENLRGTGTRTLQEYEGCPKPLRETAESQRAIHGENFGGHSSTRSENFSGENLGSGTYEGQSHTGSSHLGQSGTGRSSATGAGVAGAAGAAAATAYGEGHHGKQHNTLGGGIGSSKTNSSEDYSNERSSKNTGLTGASGTHAKPSMMDKLNPRKDADGDGKAGILD